MISIARKEDCCGCSVCASVCPKGCIAIKQDEEGFYYPIVNAEACISCGLCDSKCPIINNKPESSFEQTGYVVQHKDRTILKESTSGGAFTGLAEYIINQGGVVIGAALNEDFFVEHIIVDSVKDLSKFRNSKYVQSYIAPDIYTKLKDYLIEGRLVCFSGTACQIEALKCFLGNKNYDNLLCIDVVCRAVPSPLIFQKYIEYQNKRGESKIASLRFRDKHFGYKFPTLSIVFAGNKKRYHRGIESDPWLRAFFSGICNRPSCYECMFKKRYRISDITIWDCFNYEDKFPSMTPNLGATNVLLHTIKGKTIIKAVVGSFIAEKVNPDEQTAEISQMTTPAIMNVNRSLFFRDAQILDSTALFEKYYPNSLKRQLLYYCRVIALKSGVYTLIKKIYKMVN